MRQSVWERGEIRLRTLFEFVFIFALAYAAIQIGPAVVLEVEFLNEMTVAANSPIEETAYQIKMDLLQVAEGLGLTLLSKNLHVERNVRLKKTIIIAQYEIHINFWPRFTYVWNVKEHVEGLLL